MHTLFNILETGSLITQLVVCTVLQDESLAPSFFHRKLDRKVFASNEIAFDADWR